MTSAYHETRFSEEQRRDVLWQTLWRAYFSKHVNADDCVLDLGAGYGQFINNVVARRRIAIDQWAGMADQVADGVEPIVGDVCDLSGLEDRSVDYAFASNIFEHLEQKDVGKTLTGLHDKLSDKGVLAIRQPNYTYAYREYFDDYTHASVWSHISLADYLAADDFDVVESHPRFLPLTIKSRLPVWPLLIEAYLASPIKPMGKQMLIVAKPKR